MKIHLVFEVPDNQVDSIVDGLGGNETQQLGAIEFLVSDCTNEAFKQIDFETADGPLEVDPPVLEKIERPTDESKQSPTWGPWGKEGRPE